MVPPKTFSLNIIAMNALFLLLIRVIASYAWEQSQQDSHHLNHCNPDLVDPSTFEPQHQRRARSKVQRAIVTYPSVT
uniref:Uncharacterized protein n=1 Tax=Musa acuminata subsp. malaccensis TaxID=214687 RepID=A0A804KII5_MUSAM